MTILRPFLPSVLSLCALAGCVAVLLIRYSRKRGGAFLLLAAAVLARAGHHIFSIWVRYMLHTQPHEIGQWSGFRFHDAPHPPGLSYHVWRNITGIDNLFYILSYVLLIVLIGLELRARRDDKVRSDLERELDHSI